MDLRDLERARSDRRLRSALDARPALAQRLLFCVALVGLGVASLGWNVVTPLYRLLPAPARGQIGRAAISRIYRVFWRASEKLGLVQIDSSALDALRDEPGGLIVAANHPAMLDAMVIAARLPRAACVMKAELIRNAFLGPGAWLAQYVVNDSLRGVVREAVALLRDGHQLIYFPEGTRTVTPPINPFKPGLTLIAHLAQVPVQTIFIESRSPYLGKGWPLLRMPPLPVVVRVWLGARFAPAADHRAALDRLESYFVGELTR